MGLFDSPDAFFGGLGDGIKILFNTGKNVVNEVWDTAKSIVRAPTDIVKSVVDVAPSVIKNVTSDVKDTVIGATDKIGGAVSNLGESFAWPLTLVAGGIAAMYLLKNK